jgi:hypothetical protein
MSNLSPTDLAAFDRLRLANDDPDLHDVVEAARAPLPLPADRPIVTWVPDPANHEPIIIRPEPPVTKPKKTTRDKAVAKLAEADRLLRMNPPTLTAAASPRRRFRTPIQVPADATDVRGLLQRHGRLRVHPDRGVVTDRGGRVISGGFALVFAEMPNRAFRSFRAKVPA